MLKILPNKIKWFFVLGLLFSKNTTNAQYLAYASNSDFLDLNPIESYGSYETTTVAITKTLPEVKVNAVLSASFGKQIWMKTNLDVSKYRNGDDIPQVQDPETWSNLTTGAWCYYENNTKNGVVYGKLYNWYAVHDRRGLAPEGWHIPSDDEWTALTDFLGGANIAGDKMKLILSDPNNKEELNKNDFAGLLGGLINDAPCKFSGVGRSGIWWSSTAVYGSYAWYRGLYFNNQEVTRNYLNKTIGFSVRCVKD